MTKKVAVGYVRVSSQGQADDGLSLAEQEKRIRGYCEARGWSLKEVYRDEGISGKSLDRSGLQALLDDLKEIDVVVVVKLDRLTRSVRDLGYLLEDLLSDVSLAAVEESLDSATANGKMVINMLATVAQWEREATSERTKKILDYKKSIGEWVGRPPFGFRVNGDGRLTEDKEEMNEIRSIKLAHQRGQTLRAIAKKRGKSFALVQKITSTDLRELKGRVKRLGYELA